MLETTEYVVAGGINFIGQVSRRLKEIKDELNLEIPVESLKYCMSKVMSKILISYGQQLSKKNKTIKDKKSYNKGALREINKVYDTPLIPDNFELFIDSGGYQISVGYLEKQEIFKFIDMYLDFIVENQDKYKYAFSLDIPPNEITFDSYDDILKWNKDSYSRMVDLPNHIKDRIIYVYHFRTPKVNNIWQQILFESNLAVDLDIKRWGVGGVVAGLKGEDEIPYISYALPLSIITNFTKQQNKKFLHFHVLGGSTYRDVLFYEIAKLHIKNIHGIDVKFTFDSSGLFKQFMMGRFLDLLQDNLLVHKLSVTSSELDTRNNAFNRKVKDILYNDVLKEISDYYNLPDISHLDIYKPNNGPLYKPVELYCCIYLLHFYYILQTQCNYLAKQYYYLYLNNREEFDKLIFRLLQNLNRGKISKRLKSKTVAFSRSLDLLTDCNLDLVNGLIDKYMSKDEFKKLVRAIPTF